MSSFLLFLLGLIILAALALGFGVFSLLGSFNEKPLSATQQRLERLKKAAQNPLKGLDDDIPETQKYEFPLAFPELTEQLMGISLVNRLVHSTGVKLLQADVSFEADKFLVFTHLAPIVLGTLISVLLFSVMPIGLGIIILAGSRFWLKLKEQGNLAKLTQQLPDALNLMGSSLRVGHSLQSAMQLAGGQLPKPIGPVLNRVVSDINLGIPVKEALDHMLLLTSGLPDFQMLVTAINIQRETGGNLAEVLDNLGRTIRERFKLKGQIAALTGQSRMTGYVMGAAPATLLAGLSIFFYSYVQPLYTHPMGQVALVIGAVLQMIGFLTIRKIVQIEA